MKFYILFFTFMISASGIFGQIKRGNTVFTYLQDSDKPAETGFSRIAVFEDNRNKKGKKINLYVELLPAKIGPTNKAPIFILMGGPGQAASNLVSFFATILENVNQERDLVFIDQRGTGKSNPLKLDKIYAHPQHYFEDEFQDNELLAKNWERLSQKNNLENYGTWNATLDIESVRKAMGYKKLNIYGTSYGTRLALSYINTYPKRVRTATLKGLVPPDLIIPNQFALDAQRSLDLLIAHCEQSPECNKRYPNLAKAIQQLFAQEYPITVAFMEPGSNKMEPIEISKASIAMTLRSLLTAPSLTQQIPYLVKEANEGNYQPFLNLIYRIKKSYANGLYEAMMLCVICYEDYPKLSATTPLTSKPTFLKEIWMNRILNACQIWNPHPKRAKNSRTPKSNIPVLLISGYRDSATPPKYGAEVLTYFPKGRHLIIQNAGHSFDGMLDCVEHIISDFIVKGSPNKIKTDCIKNISLPQYKLD